MPPESEYVGSSDGLRHRSSVAVPDAATQATGEGKYTWQDVALHNSADSAWVIIDDRVFDLTRWLDNHPGGREMLLLMAGRDATAAFESYHPFTDRPRQMLSKFEIGTVVSREFPPYKRDTRGIYKEISAAVGAYFKDNGIDHKAPWPALWRMALVSAAAALAFLATNGFWPALPMSARVLTAVLFGVCQALPLLHVMHDSSHTAFGHSQGWWSIGGRLFMDYFAGANLTSWHYQHVVGHHIYTNVFEADPDLPVAPAGDPRRLVHRQTYHPMYKWQHLYLPPLYGILGLKFRFQDFTATFFGGYNGPVRVNPHSAWRWFQLFFAKAVWAAWRIGVPLAVFGVPPAQFWALFVLSEWITGYYLAFNFQVSHVSTECDYPLGATTADTIADEWAVSQIKSSVDYGHGSWTIAFLSGALNYQVTHHLFPGVSQYHYPAIAPIIMGVCAKHGVRYPCLPTFGAAFAAHIAHLRNLGRQGISADVHMG